MTKARLLLILVLGACTASDSPQPIAIRISIPRGSSTRGFGTPPSNLSGMQCFAVNVKGRGISPTLAPNDLGANHCAELGQISNLAFPNSGQAVEAAMRLKPGPDRRIQVWGFLTSSSNGCEGSQTLKDLLASGPSMYLAGERTAHVLGGTITVPLSYAPETAVDLLRCTGLALTISPTSGALSRGRSVLLHAQGGKAPYSFTQISGSGAINPSTGLFTAPPNVSNAVLRVTDAFGAIADSTIVINSSGSIGFNLTRDEGGSIEGFQAVAFQSDGKIVAAGSTNANGGEIVLARYDSLGVLDPGFGGTGIIQTKLGAQGSAIALGLALQIVNGQQRILVTGMRNDGLPGDDVVIARFKPNGSLDPSFGDQSGYSTLHINGADAGLALALRPDGKIAVAATSNSGSTVWALLYRSDGTLDTTFGGGSGKISVLTSAAGFASIAVQSDNKIVLGLSSSGAGVVARVKADGSALDDTFESDGIAYLPIGTNTNLRAVAIQSVSGSERILVGGYVTFGSQDWFWARFTPDGTPDMSFNTVGTMTKDFEGNDDQMYALIVESDGSFLSAGFRKKAATNDQDFTVTRHLVNGSIDNSFGNGGTIGVINVNIGTASDSALAMALLPTGEVALAGTTVADFALARIWQ